MNRRDYLRLTAGIAPAKLLYLPTVSLGAVDSPIDMGLEPALFVDDWCVERMSGMSRTLHPPRKMGLIKEADGSDWRRGDVYHGNIVCRDNAGKFHMTYRYHWWDPELVKVSAIGIDKAHWQRETIGYATSDDGIHWDKPKLGLLEAPAAFHKHESFPFESPAAMSKDNNLGCPIDFIYDLHAHGNVADPARRFLLRVVRREDTNQFARSLESQMYFAADWPDLASDPRWRDKLTPVSRATLSPRGFRALAGFDASAREWFVVGQDTIGNWRPRGGRDIARFASPDLVNWGGPDLALPVARDERRELDHWVEYMDMQAYRLGGMRTGCWLGQLVVFDADRSSPQHQMPTIPGVWRKGLTELRLLSSRDAGRSWQRVCGKQVWLPHHEADNGFDRLVFTAAPVRLEDQLRFYYPCHDGDHLVFNRDGTTYYKDRTRVARTAWAILRLDGYVSLDAPASGGEILTKVLRVGGARPTVNLSAPKGSLRLEIQDTGGRPINGYTEADCLPIEGDGVRLHVRWRDRPDIGGLSARTVRLRFILHKASLYGFQFGGREG